MKGFRESLEGKRVCVLGAGIAGTSASIFLIKRGAKVLISEKGRMKFDRRQILQHIGCIIEEGGHTDRILSSDLIVTSPGVPPTNYYVKRAKEIGIGVIDELELGWRFIEGYTVAITGTNGKSTVTAWIGFILGNRCAVCGNIGKPLTGCIGEREIYVIEVSSFQLARTVDFRPRIAVFLNFDQDHLDWHPTVDDYWNSKRKIFENQTDDDIAILNYDDTNLRKLAGSLRGDIMFISRRKEVRGSFIGGDTLYLNIKERIPLLNIREIQLPGQFNLENALVASLVSYILGESTERIKWGLKNFRGLPHRLELVGEKDGVKFFNDSKSTNPHSLKAALLSFDKKVILIAGGEDKDLDFKPLIPVVKERVKVMILFGKSKERFSQIFGPHLPVIKVDSLEEGVKRAFKMAKGGDIVLFSPGCSSFDLFRNYKERGKAFLDEVRKI
jgi:UDP-N-acetylmuramoylalanine--D-glutamate ligase